MKKLYFIIIFILILFITPNVFASNTNVSSKISYTYGGVKGTYEGDEIYLGGYNGRFTVGTRYNGRLGELSFYINVNDYNFTTNHTYTITLNMATEDWRNHFMGPQVIEANSSGTLGSALSVSNFRFVSYKQIKFNFRTDGSLPVYLFFRLYSTDYANPTGGNTAITGVNNWNLSSVYINNNVSATPTPAPVTPAPTPTPQPSNKDIIDNAKQNTQDIIDNQNQNTNDLIENNNQNTTDIIDNNNQNTENIIDNQKELLGNKCPNLFDKSHLASGGIYIDGEIVNNISLVYTDYYIDVEPNTEYTFSANENVERLAIAEYNSNSEFIQRDIKLNSSTYTITTTANTRFVRLNSVITAVEELQFEKGSSRTTYCEFASVLGSKLDDINNSINNSNIDNGVGSDFFDSFSNNMHGLSSIITIPLSSIQSLANSQCSPLHIPIPFTDKYLDLPCMTTIYEQHVPTLLTLIQTCWYGLLSYKVLINIFGIVKGFKDPDSDKIEVMEL